jgi:hypothetical protein
MGLSAPPQQSMPCHAQETAADDAAKNPTSPATAKVDFGLDLGSAATVEGLRRCGLRQGQTRKLLDGMRPIIALRETHNR